MSHPQRWMIVHKVALQAVLPVLRRLPYRLSVFVLGVMGRLDLIVVPHQARRYEQAVVDGARRLGCTWDVRAVSRALARQTYRWRSRDLLLDRRPAHRVLALFEVAGRDHLDAALALGQGVILLGNHFGSHMLMISWLFRQGYPVRYFGERPRNISDGMRRHFQTEGPLGQADLFIKRRVGATQLAPMVLHASRILNAGLILAMACDIRWRDARAATATFLGRTETFSSSWVNFAALTGAAVVPTYCRMDERGRYHIDFQAPYHIPRDALRTGQAAPWVQQALTALEAQIRLSPEQSNDYFFWESEGEFAA
jgi:lauroyl/myristoyl acyltransferase